MQFFLCNDNIEKCVKETCRKWVVSWPGVLYFWPVKKGTNLTRKEILALENVGFRFPQQEVILPRRLFHGFDFGGDSFIPTFRFT